jgi:hypothetical protein
MGTFPGTCSPEASLQEIMSRRGRYENVLKLLFCGKTRSSSPRAGTRCLLKPPLYGGARTVHNRSYSAAEFPTGRRVCYVHNSASGMFHHSSKFSGFDESVPSLRRVSLDTREVPATVQASTEIQKQLHTIHC